MSLIISLIGVPIVGGILCLLIPKLERVVAVIISFITLFIAVLIFFNPAYSEFSSTYFIIDNLARFVLLAIVFFGLLIVLYSLKFIKKLSEYKDISVSQYYCYILMTLGASFGAVLSNNLILLLVFWGFLGLTLYLLIQIAPDSTFSSDHEYPAVDASAVAKKSFIIIGGSDCFMILGIALIWILTGTLQMDMIHISLSSNSFINLSVIAFICLAIAAFAKAGAMPFHTWIPDMAVAAPIPVTAYLPASLDKLLGIYLLARTCINMFDLTGSGFDIYILRSILLLIGGVTIIAAVFMAMIQHDIKKLLSYHAVSQVGYMVLGIGTGNPIGIAGGLFHMVNHAIYKACLFLSGGSVEYRAGTSDLSKLGGLAKYMPITFITCLIAALAISGVPPINGFVSKWMIYQGIIQFGTNGSGLLSKFWWVLLLAAMFGSALTLASFMKLIHGIFLGQKDQHLQPDKCKEVHWTMWLPQVVLAGLCLIFGIFAFQVPLKLFIFPSLSAMDAKISSEFIGIWQPGLATMFIILGLIVGFVIYLVSNIKYRMGNTYIGGEILPDDARVNGTDFYKTIKDMEFFESMYYFAEKKMFDIYDWGKKIVFKIGSILSDMHSGNLQTYLSWGLIGIAVLLITVLI
ncbi:MAG: NADH-quinone oxidoreductase subunit L [Elusimicrobia bacterium]|nr:NADH-quinone oxidoreductase subunit L [Elusimicrobiota bacterium]